MLPQTEIFRRNLAAIETLANHRGPTPSIWAIYAAWELAQCGVEVEVGPWEGPAPALQPEGLGPTATISLGAGPVVGWLVVVQEPTPEIEHDLRRYAAAAGLSRWLDRDILFGRRNPEWTRDRSRAVVFLRPGTRLPAPRSTRALDAAVDAAVERITDPIYAALSQQR